MFFKNRFNKEAPPNMKAFAKTLLFEAARENDVSKAGVILSRYPSSITWDQGGELVLNVAIAHGSLDVVQFLIKKGADPKRSDKMGFHALSSAARHLEPAAVIRLIDFLKSYKMDINTPDDQGRSMLHVAVEKGKDDLVQILLKAGAHVDACDRQGKTPLMQAVALKKLRSASLLLDAGADVKMTTPSGETALSIAHALWFSDPLYIRELEKHFQSALDERNAKITKSINNGITSSVRKLPRIVIRKP